MPDTQNEFYLSAPFPVRIQAHAKYDKMDNNPVGPLSVILKSYMAILTEK